MGSSSAKVAGSLLTCPSLGPWGLPSPVGFSEFNFGTASPMHSTPTPVIAGTLGAGTMHWISSRFFFTIVLLFFEFRSIFYVFLPALPHLAQY